MTWAVRPTIARSRSCPTALPTPDAARGRESVHLRHAAVHEHDIEFRPCDGRDGFGPVLDHFDRRSKSATSASVAISRLTALSSATSAAEGVKSNCRRHWRESSARPACDMDLPPAIRLEQTPRPRNARSVLRGSHRPRTESVLAEPSPSRDRDDDRLRPPVLDRRKSRSDRAPRRSVELAGSDRG